MHILTGVVLYKCSEDLAEVKSFTFKINLCEKHTNAKGSQKKKSDFISHFP